jgi:hypothetical protein
MPDMQTALKTALSRTLQEWDDDGETVSPSPTINTTINNSVSTPSQGIPMPKHLFPIKNNITRTTFNYIRDNPGSTRKEIITALEHLGFNSGSTSSLIAQMRKNGLTHAKDNLYYADVDEYLPVKKLKPAKSKGLQLAREPIPKRKYERKAVTGIGALLREKLDSAPMHSRDELDAAALALSTPKERKFLTSLVRTRSPEDILKDMTVYQAHELYVHLKQMFGG